MIDLWDKVEEELGELREEVKKNSDKVEDELGDVFFALINYARYLKVHPEDALEKSNRKFIKRFQYIEEQARQTNRKLTDLSLDEMESYWQQAKNA